ncbi:MAG: hypothetical protein ACRDPV_00620 [Gaiellaceae bacterium]
MRLALALGLVALLTSASLEAVAAKSPERSQVYLDAEADVASAPDISEVIVTNDDAGRLSLKVSFANRTRLRATDVLVIGLNVDSDEHTGGPMGMDYALSATSERAVLGVWNSSSWTGSGYVPLPGAETVSVVDNSVSLTTTVDRLGALMAPRTPRLRFVILAIGDTDQPDESWIDDVAGPWTYVVEVPTKLVTSNIVLDPRPRAGGVVTARLHVTMVRGGYREEVSAADVRSRAVIAGAPLRPLHSGSTGSALGAGWHIPGWAHGRTLRGSLTISFYGARTTRTFIAAVK